MQKKKQIIVTIIGAGKVATQIAHRLVQKGLILHQIYNRSVEHGQFLADAVGSKFVADLSELDTITPNLFIISVKDDAICDIAKQLSVQRPRGMVVHTSGVMQQPFYILILHGPEDFTH